MDDNLNEPIGQVRRDQKPVRLVAQHQPNVDERAGITSGNVVEESDGYLLFLTKDLRAARVTLQRGDRIVQMGDAPNDWETDLYLVRFKRMGHYPGHGGPTLLRAYYADRHPSRQRGDL
jgi:hypothetical protein